jgi:cytochrome c
MLRISVAVLGGLLSIAATSAPQTFGACAGCHSIDGSVRLGPSLKGAYGRTAGSAEGFTYSPAMRKSGMTWDDASLDAFLTDPQKAVPGNAMPFPGVADPKSRAEIIDFLKTAK